MGLGAGLVGPGETPGLGGSQGPDGPRAVANGWAFPSSELHCEHI